MPPPTFLLQGMETLQDATFPVGETVSDGGEISTRGMMRHVRPFPVSLTDWH
jgi:hypothetical protein